MKSFYRVITAIVLVAIATAPARAQTIKDFVAWSAMMSTPFAAFAPMVTPGMTGRPTAGARAFELRYGHFAFDGGDAVNGGAVGARFGAVDVTVGYQGCSGCNGSIMIGADYDATVVSQTLTGNGASSLFTVGLRPAVGFSRPLGQGTAVTVFSGAVEVPFAVAVPVGKTARMVPFVSPGYGMGSVHGGGASESGTRASIGFGVGLIGLSPGLGFNLGWRRVFLNQTPMTVGLGLTFTH